MDAHAADPSAGRRWGILAVLAGCQLLIQLDMTIVNTAIPAIARDFEASSGTLQWVVDAYILAFAGLLLLGGAWGDRFGRRRLLSIGIITFVAASVLAAFSTSAEMLIGMRGAQGVGAALAVPQTLSLLTAVFPREERSRAIGFWAGAMGLGLASGPLIGGTLVDHVGWEGVFWIPAPVAAMGLLGLGIVPESRSPGAPRLDVLGALLGTAAMATLVFAIIEGPAQGWDHPVIGATFALSAACWLVFVLVEARVAHPMVPLGFFRQRDFVGSMLGMFFVMLALVGVLFFLAQYFQLVQGKTAFRAGLYMVPNAAMMMLIGPLAGRLLRTIGPRWMLLLGPALFGAASLLILSQLKVDSPYWLAALALGVLGAGGGLHLPAATDTTMASVPVSQAGKASAVNNAGRQLGAALGIAILGSLAASFYTADVRDALSANLPPELLGSVADGIGSAVVVARTLDPATAELVRGVALPAFVDAMTAVMLIGAALCVISGLAGWFLVPTRMRAEQATEESTARRPSAPPPALEEPEAPVPAGETAGG